MVTSLPLLLTPKPRTDSIYILIFINPAHAIPPMEKHFLLLLALLLTMLVGCTTHRSQQLVAVLQPTRGNTANGVVTFTQVSHGIQIIADVKGLQPNTRHGFHIHAFGDMRDPSGKSAGGHYNPQNQPHAKPASPKRHAGDMGNLVADASGTAHYKRVDSHITISGCKNAIIGRGVIVHAGPDTFVQPTGAAGARIAIGVIGVAKP